MEYQQDFNGHNSIEVVVIKECRRNTADVAIAKNNNESIAINECLSLIDANSLINNNDVVVITPNWVQKQKPETGIVVGPESLRAIIQFAKNQNPKRIVIATGSGQKSTPEIMKFSGFDKVIEDEGVEFIDLNGGPYTQISLNHNRVPFTKLNKLYDEMTFLISFTQLKFHEEATMSAAIKNISLGWPSAEEHGYPKKNLGIHDDLHGFIAAMAEKVPIDLSIISASPAMMGTGPAKGKPYNTGIVIAGTDPVSSDTIGARLLGFKPQAVRYLFDCTNRGIGISDIEKINIKGLTIEEAEKAFSLVVFDRSLSVDSKE